MINGALFSCIAAGLFPLKFTPCIVIYAVQSMPWIDTTECHTSKHDKQIKVAYTTLALTHT